MCVGVRWVRCERHAVVCIVRWRRSRAGTHARTHRRAPLRWACWQSIQWQEPPVHTSVSAHALSTPLILGAPRHDAQHHRACLSLGCTGLHTDSPHYWGDLLPAPCLRWMCLQACERVHPHCSTCSTDGWARTLGQAPRPQSVWRTCLGICT